MNLKTNVGLAALAMLAAVAMSPTVAADEPEPQASSSSGVKVCIVGPTDPVWCGKAGDSWVTVMSDLLGCFTSNVGHPTSGC